jgi:hypothetical protein
MTQFRTEAKEAIAMACSIFKKNNEHFALLEHAESVFLEYDPLLSILEDIFADAGHLTQDKVNTIIRASSIDLREWLPKFETPKAADQQSHFLKRYVAFSFYQLLYAVNQYLHSMAGMVRVALVNAALCDYIDSRLPPFKEAILNSLKYTGATCLLKNAYNTFILRFHKEVPTMMILTIQEAQTPDSISEGESQEIGTKIRTSQYLYNHLLLDKHFLEKIEPNLAAANLLLQEAFDRWIDHDASKFKDFMLKKISRLKTASTYRNDTNLMTIKDYLELSLEEKFFVLSMQKNNLKGSKLEPLPLEILIRIVQQCISKALPSSSLYGMQGFTVQRKAIVEATQETLGAAKPEALSCSLM